MSILVCGSLAFDTTIELGDKLHGQCPGTSAQAGQDAYYVVPDLRRNYGGCAGNICYNLRLLGKQGMPVAAVGTDFAPYAQWLDSLGISRAYLMTVEHGYTAQTFVIRDINDNRIIAFHPGAMDFAHFNRLPPQLSAHIAVIAADAFEAMRLHAQQLNEALIPYLFYPGNALRDMHSDDFMDLAEGARWVMLNEREWKHVSQLTGLREEQLAARVSSLILNKGAEGVAIYTDGMYYGIPALSAEPLDPCGAEDAFCAGLLYGLAEEIDWETSVRIALLMWHIKARHHGTQKHSFSMAHFKQQFKRSFGYALIA
jgi:adenosine kinase